MSVLQRLIVASACRSTHHYLAMTALERLAGPDAEGWRGLFLARHEAYLRGAKAPDDVFRDSRNQVLHVGDGYWGGAVGAAEDWYGRARSALAAKRWEDGVYAAGVLSHYYTDPIQPLHTGQTEDEAAIHRAFEWSVAKSYPALISRLAERLGGFPAIPTPAGEDWLAGMVRAGAEAAHPHYETVIDHYDLAAGSSDPLQGLDDTLMDVTARLLGLAAAGFAVILARLLAEAGVRPPRVSVTLATVLAGLKVPFRAVAARMENASERALVQATYAELAATGRVRETLSDDDRAVRALHAAEVLERPLAELDHVVPRPAGTRYGKPPAAHAKAAPPAPPERAPAAPPPRSDCRLDRADPVVDAPAIGPRTAERLAAIGVLTVGDLLDMDAEDTAERLDARHISVRVLKEWRAMAALACGIAGLRGVDAQLLVGVGIAGLEDLAAADAVRLAGALAAWAETGSGARILRSSRAPALREIEGWIAAARAARRDAAA